MNKYLEKVSNTINEVQEYKPRNRDWNGKENLVTDKQLTRGNTGVKGQYDGRLASIRNQINDGTLKNVINTSGGDN